jgi:hypothetical protein
LRTMRRLGWSGLIAVLSVSALVLALAVPLGPPWRLAAALLFVFVSPGASLVPLIGLRDLATELVLVVPVSFALVILVAVVLFYSGLWTPGRQLAVLLALCVGGLTVRLIQILKAPQPETERNPDLGLAGPKDQQSGSPHATDAAR